MSDSCGRELSEVGRLRCPAYHNTLYASGPPASLCKIIGMARCSDDLRVARVQPKPAEPPVCSSRSSCASAPGYFTDTAGCGKCGLPVRFTWRVRATTKSSKASDVAEAPSRGRRILIGKPLLPEGRRTMQWVVPAAEKSMSGPRPDLSAGAGRAAPDLLTPNPAGAVRRARRRCGSVQTSSRSCPFSAATRPVPWTRDQC